MLNQREKKRKMSVRYVLENLQRRNEIIMK